MSKRYLLLPVIAILSLSACSKNNSSSSQPVETPPQLAKGQLNQPNKVFNRDDTRASSVSYINSINSLSKNFYNQVYEGKNLVFSPVSIATCYSMLYEGADNNSKEQLKEFLHYDDSFDYVSEIKNMLLRNAIDDPENKIYLDLAQSFWVDDDFADHIYQDYIDKLTNDYYAEAFQGKLETNEMHQALADYINKKTNNFLDMKADDFAEYRGVLWLLNTIYLKSAWQYEFKEDLNYTAKFTNLDQSKNNQTFMQQQIESYYLERDNYAIASIPFTHGLRFNIMLPNNNSDYSKCLTDEAVIDDLYNFPLSEEKGMTKIKFFVPKFKLRSAFDLKKILPNLGLVDIFNSDLADLTKIGSSRETLYVSRSKHEAGIEVNNEGAEAAAYTIIEVSPKATSTEPSSTVNFNIDHPFTYSISNRDGLTLFTGVVTNL